MYTHIYIILSHNLIYYIICVFILASENDGFVYHPIACRQDISKISNRYVIYKIYFIIIIILYNINMY